MHDEAPMFIRSLRARQDIYIEVTREGESMHDDDGVAQVGALGPTPVKWIVSIAQRYVVVQRNVIYPFLSRVSKYLLTS